MSFTALSGTWHDSYHDSVVCLCSYAPIRVLSTPSSSGLPSPASNSSTMATGSPLGSPKSSPKSSTTTSTITPCADYPRRASTASAFAKSAGQEAPLRLMGRRTTTRNLDVDQTEALAYDGDDNTPSKIGQYLHRVHSASVIARYALYILPVSMLLAVPMIVTANAPYRADGIRLLGLFIWVEIIWLTFWVTDPRSTMCIECSCNMC